MPTKIYPMCSVKTWVRSFQRALATRYLTKPGRPHAGYWFPTKRNPVVMAPGETYTQAYVRQWTEKNNLKK